ncbi:MAG: FliH/SctL family protein [Dehalococcoidia bacterium]
MNSSAKPRRVFRSDGQDADVFIVGLTQREELPTPGPIADAQAVSEAAHERAASIIAAAEREAAAILASVGQVAAEARGQGHSEGFELGRIEAEAEFEACLAIARRAAAEGKAIRDSVAEESAAVVARAASLATRRIVADYYDADPQRTLAICLEAIRAASGQTVLALRVHPSVGGAVQAALGDQSSYVRPDPSIEIGGCIVDVRNGVIDASLNARLTLMELALAAAGGEVAA